MHCDRRLDSGVGGSGRQALRSGEKRGRDVQNANGAGREAVCSADAGEVKGGRVVGGG